MPQDNTTKSWWSSLAGTLAATATLVTAIGGFLVILHSNGCLGKQTNPAPDSSKIPTPVPEPPSVSQLTPAQLNDSAEAARKIMDYKKALNYYKRSANLGDSKGQYKYGQMYEFGEGVTTDDSEAIKWYIKSANQGNAAGQFKLGFMYEMGYGTKADTMEAIRWFRKSADQGDDFAEEELGYFYSKGIGGLRDDVEAVRLFRAAAEQRNAAAQNNIGVMTENGLGGLSKDLTQAQVWYNKSADQGFQEAKNNLTRLQQAQQSRFGSH